jgi:imidazolonepropionase-like amidohydrolase
MIAEAGGPIVLVARRLVDVAAGAYIEPGRVLIEEGRITAVGEAVAGDVADRAVKVDLGGLTVLPGLIDMHTHMFLHSNRMRVTERPEQDNMTYMILQEYPSHRIARAVRALRIALENGFTTIRDCGTEGAGYDDVGLRDAVAEGIIPGPRTQVAGPAVSPTGTYHIVHYRPDWRFPSGVMTCDGPEDCRRVIREQVSYGVDWIKVYATAGYGTHVTDDGYIDGGRNWTNEEFGAIVDEAHARGVRVAAHATTLTGTDQAIDAGVDTIEHAHSIRPAQARRLATAGIAIVPTLTTSVHTAAGRAGPIPPLWSRIPEVQLRSLRNARDAGVRVLMGTDMGSGSVPWTDLSQAIELVTQVEHAGLTPAEALKTATLDPAQTLGLQGRVGQLATGADADVIAVDGDPLEEIGVLQHVAFVMQRGTVIKPIDASTAEPRRSNHDSQNAREEQQ